MAKPRKKAILGLREKLLKRHSVLRKTLASDFSWLQELISQDTDDPAVVAALEGEVSSQLIDILTQKLSLTEHALERMRDGKYGVCEKCGANIPMARLNALPYVERCIKCQLESERLGNKESRANWGRLPNLSGDDEKDSPSFEDVELDR